MVTAHRIRVSALVPVVLSLLCGLSLAGPAAALDEARTDPVGVWPLRRLAQVEELTGLNLDDPGGRVSASVALQAHSAEESAGAQILSARASRA